MDEAREFFFNNELISEAIGPIIVKMIMCLLLAIILQWFFRKYSRSLGSKSHVGSIIPLISLTVFLVILVVKNSLALSLGLVGALSIVRFRTPIKEPEELGYLFLAIAIGLGFGAGYVVITIIVVLSILLYLWFVSPYSSKKYNDGEYTLIITSSNNIEENNILKIINPFFTNIKTNRVEINNKNKVYYLNVTIGENYDLDQILHDLRLNDENIEINMIESGINW